MNPGRIVLLAVLLILILTVSAMSQSNKIFELPSPRLDSEFSVEKALLQRRSVREYSVEAITLEQLSQLLWACQGISSELTYERAGKSIHFPLRTAPSAGALYPLEVYVVVSRVTGLDPGIYHYIPGNSVDDHRLKLLQDGDKAYELARAALGQDCIKNAAVNFVIGTVISRTAVKYGDRAERYVFIETGHAGQNICLQAQAFNLGTVTVGAFNDDKVRKLIGTEAEPVYIICAGKRR